MALAFGHWSTTQPITEPTVVQEAERLYGSDVMVYASSAHEWNQVFPSYALYTVVKLSRHPVPIHVVGREAILIQNGYDLGHSIIGGTSVSKARAMVWEDLELDIRVVCGKNGTEWVTCSDSS